MSEEEIEKLSLEPNPISPEAKKVVNFFAGEGEDVDAILKKETLTDLIAMSFSLHQTEKEISEKREKLNAEIKRQLDADKMARGKVIKDFDERKVILTKKAGRTSILWEKYVEDECGEAALKELKDSLEEVKKGALSHKYIEQGKESVSMEIV